jgi:hypothetical protein
MKTLTTLAGKKVTASPSIHGISGRQAVVLLFIMGGLMLSMENAWPVDPPKRPKLERKNEVRDLMLAQELAKASEAARQESSKLWEEGFILFEKKSYDNAVKKFSEAYEIYPRPGGLVWEGRARVWSKNPAVRSEAKACLASVVSDTDATDKDKKDALDLLGELLKQTLTADEKATFSKQLSTGAPSIAWGKLFGEAFNEDPKVNYAYESARGFAGSGDKTRAAQIYRSLLKMKLPQNKQLFAAHARTWLADNRFDIEAKYPHTLSVGSDYTRTEKPSAKYKEEITPVCDVWAVQILPATTGFLGLSQYYGTDCKGKIDIFKHRTIHPLGTKIDQKQLLEQCISYYVAQENWTDSKKNEKLSPLGLDPKKLPTAWPLVDAIQSTVVTYLNTEAERSPYLLSFNKDGLLTLQGEIFDTSDMSTMFSGKEWAIYVMSPDGKIYAASHRVSAFHHSSFLAGADVAGAGEMKVDKGRLIAISNKSGHYRPKVINLVQTIEGLLAGGMNVQAMEDIIVRVGGDIGNSHFETKVWPGKAGDFYAQFRAADHSGFMRNWTNNLKFKNDPFD